MSPKLQEFSKKWLEGMEKHLLYKSVDSDENVECALECEENDPVNRRFSPKPFFFALVALVGDRLLSLAVGLQSVDFNCACSKTCGNPLSVDGEDGADSKVSAILFETKYFLIS